MSSSSRFEKRGKKYRLVEAEQRVSGKKLHNLTFDLKSDIKCSLPNELQDMVKEMVCSQPVLVSN